MNTNQSSCFLRHLIPVVSLSFCFLILTVGTSPCAADQGFDSLIVWPQPKQIEISSKSIRLANLRIDDQAKAHDTRSVLQQRLRQQYGFYFAETENSRPLILGRLASPKTQAVIRDWAIAYDRRVESDDGFLIAIRPQGILLAAPNDRGLYYAVRALLQIIDHSTPAGDAPQARFVTVSDWPDQAMRALFWRLDTQRGGRYDIEFLKDYIDRIVAGARYNTIVLMMRRGLEYESAPGVGHRNAFTQQEFKDLVAFCRQCYLDVVPATNTPGHADWLLRTRFLDLAELNDATICTRNPAALKLIFGVNQELIDLCGGPEQVKFFHVGHDEIRWTRTNKGYRQIHKSCPRCTGTPYQDILLEYIGKEHEWFAQRDIRMMMWSDMFAAGHNGSEYHTATLTRQMPRDITLVPWSALDYSDIETWADEGFEVIKGATGYKQLSIGDPVVSGHLLALFSPSPWLTFTTTDTSSHNYYNHLSVLLFADNAWNNDPTFQARNDRERTNLKFTVQKRAERRKLNFLLERGNALNFLFAHRRFPAETDQYVQVDLSPYANRPLKNCFGAGEEYDLSDLITGAAEIAGIPARIPQQLVVPEEGSSSHTRIPVGTKVASLIFLQTAYLPEKKTALYRKRIGSDEPMFNMTARNSPIGYYRIRYREGSEHRVPINFGLNVSHLRPPLHSRYPCDVRFVYRVAGEWPEARDCRELTPGAPALYQYEWVNPHPNQEIDSFEFVSFETEVVPAFLAVTARLAQERP